jgi:hypothetical protein
LPYLTAAVVLVGIVAIAALLLVIALARRIRELSESVGGLGSRQQPSTYELPPGSRPTYFRAEAISGGTVSLDALSGGRALVGFFLAGCVPCDRQIPAFADLARTIPGGPSQVVAVVSGRQEKAVKLAGQLDGIASVVLENPGAGEGSLSHAFSVSSWPSYYLIGSEGTVESSAGSMSMLAVPASAGNLR